MGGMDDDNQDTIVAITPCCGRVVFAAVNLPDVMDHDMHKEIGRLVMDGCRIEHWTFAAVRKSKFGCKCKLKAA